MLSESRIRELFYEYLPNSDGVVVSITSQSHEDYIAAALRHPFIQDQIEKGIYTKENIGADFLSPARVHVDIHLQVICMQVFDQLLDGIPDDIAENYVRYIAAHEAHHFHDSHEHSDTPLGTALGELACIRRAEQAHPELDVARAYVESHSKPFIRVFARISNQRKVPL